MMTAENSNQIVRRKRGERAQIKMLRILRSLGGKLIQSVFRRKVTVGGRTYATSRYSATPIDLDFEHESWINPIFKAVLEAKTGAFIDVGVNRGQTFCKLLYFAPDRPYVGFEPQVSCAYAMERFIENNDLRNTIVIPVGLADKAGLCRIMRRSGISDSTASIVTGFRPESFYNKSSFIPIMKGDDALKDVWNDDICVIKIDVEGGELEVLKGLEGTLSQRRPFLIFEVLNNYLIVGHKEVSQDTINFRNERANAITDFLHNRNYRLFNIIGGRIVNIARIVPIVSDDITITDYIAIPDEVYDRSETLSAFDGLVSADDV